VAKLAAGLRQDMVAADSLVREGTVAAPADTPAGPADIGDRAAEAAEFGSVAVPGDIAGASASGTAGPSQIAPKQFLKLLPSKLYSSAFVQCPFPLRWTTPALQRIRPLAQQGKLKLV
jgi:hypothetical protein